MILHVQTRSTSAPLGEPSLSEVDEPRRRSLGTLRKEYKGKKNPALSTLEREQEAIARVHSVGAHLIDISPEMTRDTQALPNNIAHRTKDSRRVFARQSSDEAADRRRSSRAPVVPPAMPDRILSQRPSTSRMRSATRSG